MRLNLRAKQTLCKILCIVLVLGMMPTLALSAVAEEATDATYEVKLSTDSSFATDDLKVAADATTATLYSKVAYGDNATDATYALEESAITFDSDDVLSVSSLSSAEGVYTIGLSVTPPATEKTVKVTLKYNKIGEDLVPLEKEFTITVAAKSGETVYKIEVATDIVGGTVTADKTEAKAGDKVTLTNEAENGYTFKSYTVTGKTTNEAVVVADDGTFTMIGDDVTVSATFEQEAGTFKVNLPVGVLHGTVTADKTTDLEEGDTVTLTAEPESGYRLESLNVYKVSDSAKAEPLTLTPDAEDENKCSFVMPAEDVDVAYAFVADIVEEDIEQISDFGDDFDIKVEGDKITITYSYTCIVAVTFDDGATYYMVPAVKNDDGTYTYDLSALANVPGFDMSKIKITAAVLGDTDGDGILSADDALDIILASLHPENHPLNGLYKLIYCVSGGDTPTADDALDVVLGALYNTPLELPQTND